MQVQRKNITLGFDFGFEEWGAKQIIHHEVLFEE